MLAVIVLTSVTPSRVAWGGDPWEFWPELNAFVRLQPRARLYFVTAYAKGKESPNRTVDMAGYVDVSLMPILRPVRGQEDWARNRYLWTRVGYDHVFEAEGQVRTPSEERGILSIYGKEDLPGGVWLEGRVREDLRWISGEFSTRDRLRAEATREFSLRGHPVTPYLNAEWFYDHRYDGWSRILYMLGTEITTSEHLRFEAYLARQKELLPKESALNALGALVKLYY
jgi:hypothetical protein